MSNNAFVRRGAHTLTSVCSVHTACTISDETNTETLSFNLDPLYLVLPSNGRRFEMCRSHLKRGPPNAQQIQ
jgi:hypothetical protein